LSCTAELRRYSLPAWERAVRAPFLREPVMGTLPSEMFKRYFLQDYVFAGELRRVNGLAAARATDIELARRRGEFLAVLLGAEDPLSRRALDSLGVPRNRYQGVQALPVTRAFSDFRVRTGYGGSFEEVCGAPCVTERVRLDRAIRLRKKGARPAVVMYREWFHVHDQAARGPFVNFVEVVVDAGAYGANELRRIGEIPGTTLDYEASSWDMDYGGGVDAANQAGAVLR